MDYDPFFTSASQVPGLPLDAREANLDTVYSETLSRFAMTLYKVPVEAGRNLLCRVTPGSAESIYGLYTSFMSVPSVAFADTSSKGESLSGSHELLIAETRAGDYYILVFALDIQGDQDHYQIEFSYVDHYVSSLSPGESGNRGPATLNLYGTDFSSETRVRLLSAGGRAYSAHSVIASDPAHLHASINLQGAALGMYDLEIGWPSQPAALLFPGAFEVVPGMGPRLETKLQIPNTIVWYRPYTMMLSYKNTGDSDLVAPIIKVVTKSKDSGISLTPGGPYLYEAGDFVQVLGIAEDGPAGVLPPGGTDVSPSITGATEPMAESSSRSKRSETPTPRWTGTRWKNRSGRPTSAGRLASRLGPVCGFRRHDLGRLSGPPGRSGQRFVVGRGPSLRR